MLSQAPELRLTIDATLHSELDVVTLDTNHPAFTLDAVTAIMAIVWEELDKHDNIYSYVPGSGTPEEPTQLQFWVVGDEKETWHLTIHQVFTQAVQDWLDDNSIEIALVIRRRSTNAAIPA